MENQIKVILVKTSEQDAPKEEIFLTRVPVVGEFVVSDSGQYEVLRVVHYSGRTDNNYGAALSVRTYTYHIALNKL